MSFRARSVNRIALLIFNKANVYQIPRDWCEVTEGGPDLSVEVEHAFQVIPEVNFFEECQH